MRPGTKSSAVPKEPRSAPRWQALQLVRDRTLISGFTWITDKGKDYILVGWYGPTGNRFPKSKWVLIDPATGQLAKVDTVTKRTELFINGTSPGSESAETTDDIAQDPSAQPEEDRQTEPAGLPEPQPSESPKPKPTPKADANTKSRVLSDGESSEKLQGTITLDIDPTTGLIAVESCPVIRTKTFIIGQEPKKYCGPEYHKKAQPSPPNTTRARVVNP